MLARKFFIFVMESVGCFRTCRPEAKSDCRMMRDEFVLVANVVDRVLWGTLSLRLEDNRIKDKLLQLKSLANPKTDYTSKLSKNILETNFNRIGSEFNHPKVKCCIFYDIS